MRRRAWLALLAAGPVWALAYLAAPRHGLLSNVLDDMGGFVAAAAVVLGVRLHRPARPAPWLFFAGAQLCSGAGDVLWSVYEEVLHDDPFPSLADVLYLASYPLFTAGLFLLARRRAAERDIGGLLDAGIVSAGLGLLSWTVLMRPIAADDTLSLTGQLVSLAYPLADVVLIAVLARLLTTQGARTAGFRLLTASLLLVLAADVGFAVLSTVASYDGGALDTLWILGYACCGAAALHPSMRDVGDPGTAVARRLTFRRFALLGVTTLVAPVVLAEQGLTDPTGIDWRGVTHRGARPRPAHPRPGLDPRRPGPGPVRSAGGAGAQRPADRVGEPSHLGPGGPAGDVRGGALRRVARRRHARSRSLQGLQRPVRPPGGRPPAQGGDARPGSRCCAPRTCSPATAGRSSACS